MVPDLVKDCKIMVQTIIRMFLKYCHFEGYSLAMTILLGHST